MTLTPVRVLLVEDDQIDRLACRRALANHPEYAFDLIEVETGRQGIQLALQRHPDLILLDYHLPDLSGLEFLAELRREEGEMPMPVMMLTGTDNVGVAVEAMRRGAHDYLVKDSERNYLELLPAVIERVLREQRLRTEKRAAEAQFRTLVEQIPAITYIAALDVPGRLLYISPQVRDLGFSPEEWLADAEGLLKQIHPDDRAAVHAAYAGSYEKGEPLRCEYRVLTPAGETRWLLDEARTVRDAQDRPLFLQGVLIDITEDKRTEEELRYHRKRLEELVAKRTEQLEKQADLLRSANANLIDEIEVRRRAEAEATRYAEEVRDLYDRAPCGYHSLDADGVYTRINDTELGWLGFTREEVIGRRFIEFLTPASVEFFKENFPRFKEKGEIYNLEFELLRRDGSTLPVELSATVLRDEAGNYRASRSTLFDISARRQAERALRASEARFRLLLESAGEGIVGLDSEGRCSFVNDAALGMLGFSREELLDRPIRLCPEDAAPGDGPCPGEECAIRDAYRSGVGRTGMIETLWRKDGSTFTAEVSSHPLREDGSISGAVLVFRDVTESQALAARLAWQATHDALTGLVNRREFERRLAQLLESVHRDGGAHTLCYLDLDQFKVVNDTCGHAAGDELLRQLSELLQGRMRQRDTLARLGGDEFGILLEHCPTDQALRIALELRDVVRGSRFSWQGHSFTLGTSIGVAPLTADMETAAEALSAADAACYVAKERGRNRAHLYDAGDAGLIEQRGEMQWVSRLTDALDEGRFRLYYQPVVPLSGGPPARPHYEVFLRLLEPDGRLVEPMAFVPAAERYNLMPAIDRWVLREVVSAVSAVQNAPEPPPMFAVNLSARSLVGERLADYLRDLLATRHVPGDMLCLEIAETAALANLKEASQQIAEFKRLGCRVALDDFGGAMSSFSYLKTLRVDYLKIEGGIVRSLADDRVNRAVADAINRVAHVMSIQTVAKCAETDAVVAILKELGIDHAQGHALAPPRPIEELAAAAFPASPPA
jgi:diguanylate cyclase (GGDEF)-like protein/PAS domain S-box-containing protein